MAHRRLVTVPGQKTPVGAYSPALVSGNLVFVSGQGPLDPETHQIIGKTIEEQTTATLQNVERLLRAAGCDLNDCVKATVHLLNMKDFDRFNSVYKSFFRPPYPTRTTVQSGLWNNILVEIDVIAVRDRDTD